MIRSASRTDPRGAVLAGLLVLASTLGPGSALAQSPTPARDPAAAETLYQSARDLLKANDWAGGCAKFDAAFALNGTAAILLNIARCHDHEGKLSLAMADYEHALVLNRETAGEERQKQLEGLARDGLAALKLRVPKLRIVVKGPPAGITVTRDGRELAAAALGEALPVDPGGHEIVAMASGYRVERRTVTVAEGSTAEVEISLLAQPGPVAGVPAVEPKSGEAPVAPVKRGIPAWVWVSGGLGIAVGAVGVGFAVDAAKAKGTLGEKCRANAAGVPVCSDKEFTQADVDGLNGRKNRGFPAAWGLGAVGVAGVAAAIVGVAMAGRTAAPVGWVGPAGGGVGVKGVF